MKIGLDCDDVLANFTLDLASAYNRRYGTSYNPEDFVPDFSHFERLLGLPGIRNLWELFQDHSYNLSMKPVKGAVAGVKELVSLGAELLVVTNRVKTSPQITQQWLEQNFGPVFSDVLYGGNGSSKGEICRQKEISLFVDDLPQNVYNLRDHGIKTLVLDYHWNREVEESHFIKRILDWEELVQEVKARR